MALVYETACFVDLSVSIHSIIWAILKLEIGMLSSIDSIDLIDGTHELIIFMLELSGVPDMGFQLIFSLS